MPPHDPSIAQELLAHQGFLRQLAVDLVGEEADDLVQDVWQRALERPPRHARRLRGWLARVTRNLATSRWRVESRREAREERRAREGLRSSELEERLELRKELVASLDALPEAGREAILLRYFEGLAPREIARRQGVSRNTALGRMHQATKKIHAALSERGLMTESRKRGVR